LNLQGQQLLFSPIPGFKIIKDSSKLDGKCIKFSVTNIIKNVEKKTLYQPQLESYKKKNVI